MRVPVVAPLITKIIFLVLGLPGLLTGSAAMGQPIQVTTLTLTGDTLNAKRQPPGWHEVVFEATGLPNGVYFYRLETGSFQASGQMLLIK